MGEQRRRAVRLVAGLVGVTFVLGCGDSAGPEVVGSEWPWPTNVSSTRVAVTGAVEIAPQEQGALRVKARFVNPSSDSVAVSHGACNFGVRLRLVNGRALMPVAWENRPDFCTLPLFNFSVAPASFHDVDVGVIRPSSVRGAVPPGEYFVNVIWRRHPSTELLEVNAGTLVVP